MIDAKLITTAGELLAIELPETWGLYVASLFGRAALWAIGASLQTCLVATSRCTLNCARRREDVHRSMVEHASQLGANAIIAVRYDATEIAAGVAEVLAYGTAVYVEVFRDR